VTVKVIVVVPIGAVYDAIVGDAPAAIALPFANHSYLLGEVLPAETVPTMLTVLVEILAGSSSLYDEVAFPPVMMTPTVGGRQVSLLWE
jgi:hypothetical protein